MAAAGLLSTISLAQGADPKAFTAGSITVEQPWSRATPGGSKTAIGYLTIRNAGDEPDRLTGITTDVARTASPHTMTMKDGIMTMRPMTGGVVIPAHGSVVFRPGADHLMLQDLKRPLKQGETFAGTLTFQKAGSLPVVFEVEAIGAQAPAGNNNAAATPKQ